MTDLKHKNILFFLPANDFNEEEFLLVKNTFRESSFRIFIASDSHSLCNGNNGMKVKADVNLYNVHAGNFEAFILIGGNGMRTYWNNQTLINIVRRFYESGKLIGAICSAPVLLANAGIIRQHQGTCYPGDRNEFEKAGGKYTGQPVVSCGNIVTAQCPEDALEFSRTIRHKIVSK